MLKYITRGFREHSDKKIEDISVKIVTTDFHALRSNLLAQRNGYKNIDFYTSNTVIYLIPESQLQ